MVLMPVTSTQLSLALIQFHTFSSAGKTPSPGARLKDLPWGRKVVSDDARPRLRTIAAIQRSTAELFGATVEELVSQSYRGAVRVSRKIAMYLASQMTDASLEEIGQSFGGRKASSVRRAIAKIQAEKLADVRLQRVLSKLERQIKQS